jgi:hypothetical protein
MLSNFLGIAKPLTLSPAGILRLPSHILDSFHSLSAVEPQALDYAVTSRSAQFALFPTPPFAYGVCPGQLGPAGSRRGVKF